MCLQPLRCHACHPSSSGRQSPTPWTASHGTGRPPEQTPSADTHRRDGPTRWDMDFPPSLEPTARTPPRLLRPPRPRRDMRCPLPHRRRPPPAAVGHRLRLPVPPISFSPFVPTRCPKRRKRSISDLTPGTGRCSEPVSPRVMPAAPSRRSPPPRRRYLRPRRERRTPRDSRTGVRPRAGRVLG